MTARFEPMIPQLRVTSEQLPRLHLVDEQSFEHAASCIHLDPQHTGRILVRIFRVLAYHRRLRPSVNFFDQLLDALLPVLGKMLQGSGSNRNWRALTNKFDRVSQYIIISFNWKSLTVLEFCTYDFSLSHISLFCPTDGAARIFIFTIT